MRRPARGRPPDHPRSRGVYRRIPTRLSTRRGSSPLARGLPGRCGGMRPAASDHPRSRGVYAAGVLFALAGLGSSPLARGLPLEGGRSAVILRIIPARAGFTLRPRPSSLCRGDHPRSRGVYLERGWYSLYASGSSPLARGLHRRPPGRRLGRRIIPARAGFTPSACRKPRSRPDHPRSRGVYDAVVLTGPDGRGSSPLARGLPLAATAALLGGRIIPARAGFTDHHATQHAPPRDHPRSRGVYEQGRLHSEGSRGSSPLARGLLDRVGHIAPAGGIIPARAGFTEEAS